MNVIVTGAADHVLTPRDAEFLERTIGYLMPQRILTEGNQGFGRAVTEFAERRGIPVLAMTPNWSVHGDAAGLRNNEAMVRRAHAVVAFPGGFLVAHLIVIARDQNVSVFESPSRLREMASLTATVVQPLPAPRMGA